MAADLNAPISGDPDTAINLLLPIESGRPKKFTVLNEESSSMNSDMEPPIVTN